MRKESSDRLPVLVFAALLLLGSVRSSRSAEEITPADYQRAAGLRSKVRGLVTARHIRPHWLEDNERFWYRNDLLDDRRQFILVDAKKGVRDLAFDHERLAGALSLATDSTCPADRLAIDRLDFSEDGSMMTFSFAHKRWTCSLKDYTIRQLEKDKQQIDSLPPRSNVRRSTGTGDETFITFINQTKKSVYIYWLDTGGKRRRYATLQPEESHEQHTYAGHAWLATDSDGERLSVFVATEDPADAVIDGKAANPPDARRTRGQAPRGESPNGKWIAMIKDHNLFVRESSSDKEVALTNDGTEDDEYSGRFYWSPDSQKLVVLRTKKGYDRKVHVIEAAPDDQLQPELHTFSYRKPGDEIDLSRPCLFNVAEKRQISVCDELFPNPWSLSEIRWAPDSSRFTFLYNQRGHQVLRIIGVHAETGQARAIVDEQSDTFIDYAGKQYSHYLDKTHEIIWMSERDGWNHLYMYDADTGRVKNQITSGRWVVRGVDNVDEQRRTIHFTAGGREPDRDPYFIQYYRVNFDGTGLTCLTPGKGTHEVQYSPDRRYMIDTYSTIDKPPVHELRRTSDGSLVCDLEKADASALFETGWTKPEPFVAKGRDGRTNIYGVIWRPAHFNASKQYPVIEKIYAGPHGSFVPKSWKEYESALALAELGFIVVQIDGMGTSHRSKAFHDVCWKNLGDSGFPDRILWMKAAARKYTYMDISRVGIYGGSAGGQSALRALLAHGDFYKVAVADCGCHDNRMDKIWWNELWMGWPIGPHYEEQSNVTQAHKLRGKLLLTVGEMDRNVDPASTMQVVDALVKAEKDFDLLVVPGAGHGVGETPYANRRRMDFFVRNLLEVEPPNWNHID